MSSYFNLHHPPTASALANDKALRGQGFMFKFFALPRLSKSLNAQLVTIS